MRALAILFAISAYAATPGPPTLPGHIGWINVPTPASCSIAPLPDRFAIFDFYKMPSIVVNVLRGHRAGLNGLQEVNLIGTTTFVPVATNGYLCKLNSEGFRYNGNRDRACGDSYCGTLEFTTRSGLPVYMGILRTESTPPTAGLTTLKNVGNGNTIVTPYHNSCDEYPFASTFNGGGTNNPGIGAPNWLDDSSVVACVHESENSAQGSEVRCASAGSTYISPWGIWPRQPFVEGETYWIKLLNVPQAYVTGALPSFCIRTAGTFTKGGVMSGAIPAGGTVFDFDVPAYSKRGKTYPLQPNQQIKCY